MSEISKINPAGFNRNEIKILADLFAEKLKFQAGNDNIRDFVTKKLGGVIEYDDSKIKKDGGSIEVINNGTPKFTIYLSNYTLAKRDSLIIAHELGHYFLHSKMGKKELKANKSSYLDAAEIEANIFADYFLLPDSMLKTELENKTDIISISDKYNVPFGTLLTRIAEYK